MCTRSCSMRCGCQWVRIEQSSVRFLTPRLLSIAAAVLLFLPSAAVGQVTWLVPQRSTVVAGGRVRLQLCNGMWFPECQLPPPRPERIAATHRRLAGLEHPLWVGKPNGPAPVLFADAGETVVAALAVDLWPDSLQRTDAEVGIRFPAHGKATGFAGPR